MHATNASDQQQQSHVHQQPQQQQPWVPQPPPPQWMAPPPPMQYPAAAMVMMQQHMMMYPHQYMPYNHPFQYQHPYQQQQQQQRFRSPHRQFNNGSSSPEEAKTIWVGDLLHWMDETYLHSCFSHAGEVSSVKVIRNKQTGQSEGYGFVEFSSHENAEKVLQGYNGSPMPKADQPFRLNWASFSSNERRTEGGSDLSIFVGDLAADVTDAMLQEVFAERFPSVKGAKVVIDSNTGRSKGYGFVRFSDENERSRAITEMNGAYCSSRQMRIGVATPKKPSGYQQYSSQVVSGGQHASNGVAGQGFQADSESNNATIFVGGIDSDVTDEDLRNPFSQYGEIVSVKIPTGKGCGFVQFANRKNAEDALQNLNGTTIGKQTVRLAWGRSPGYKQWRADHNNQWNGGYYRGHVYGANGYNGGLANEDAGMYASAAVPGAS